MKVEIEIPEGKIAKWVNGVLTLVDNKQRDVTERIKTFEDARNELGEEHPFVKAYDRANNYISESDDDVEAYLKLRIICAALNKGWEPEFKEEECRYLPWFHVYTKREINKLTDRNKKLVWMRSNSDSSANGSVVYANAYFVASGTLTGFASCLAFKTRELAEYAGKRFIEIWADYIYSSPSQNR